MKYAAPIIACFLILSSGCGSDTAGVIAGPDVILSPEGVKDPVDTLDIDNLPINLQVGSETNGIASASPRNDINSDYSGKIVIKFEDGTDVRLRPEDRNGPFVSLAGADVRAVNELVRSPLLCKPAPSKVEGEGCGEVDTLPPLAPPYKGGETIRGSPPDLPLQRGGVASITRVTSASEEQVDEWLAHWQRQGVAMHDWNLYYYLEVPEYEDAVELVSVIASEACPEQCRRVENQPSFSTRPSDSLEEYSGEVANALVEYVGILPVFYLTQVTTPDISNEQGYLKSAASGGLGIEDGWAKLDALFPDIKLRGQNTMVVDQEYDWNFDHEILPIDETDEYLKKPKLQLWQKYGTNEGKNIPANINHGTAVVGVIAGQGNGIGKAIKGIVPYAAMGFASMSDNGVLGPGTMFAEDETPVGSILTVEVQQKGITTGTSGCSVGDGVSSPAVTGCVPIESHKFIHDAISDSSAIGNIVIEGAGNGSVNLDNDNQAAPKEGMGAYSYFSDPANDSGAIMVGASLGASKKKAAWSNCGSRVDVFAWGAGVVTAGYGDKFNPDGADPGVTGPMGADNPKLYTGQFGGTSAATAEIAGMAAMIQSYVRQLVAEAGYEPKVVYLDSKQMRTILKNSGQAAVYGQTPNDPNPNCNIGVQPDLAKAIDETNEFLNAGNVLKVVPLNGDSNDGVVSGIRYDMDGDDRAELISFSRDHKWYIDLSSVPCTNGPTCGDDGYGEWDVIFSIPSPLPVPSGVEGVGEGQGEGVMLFPVVHDYNSDGRADLALYDSINGKWYIKYTTTSVIASEAKQPPELLEWDRIIDYTSDPAWKAYSRPVPGDYDGDNWLDTGLQTPDGHWLIDYGGFAGGIEDGITINVSAAGDATVTLVNPSQSKLDAFDKDVKYLTDDQLAQAPGWAWLPIPYLYQIGSSKTDIAFVAPDGTPAEESFSFISAPDFEDTYPAPSVFSGLFNGNDNIILPGCFDKDYSPSMECRDLAMKTPGGSWKTSLDFDYWSVVFPSTNEDGFGDYLCRPISADFDGDGFSDKSVQCGTNWKIVTSSNDEIREIELEQAIDPVPAYVYAGGIKYQEQVDLFNYYKTKLPCDTGSNCTVGNTIFDVVPPIGPYFAECVKYWEPNASYCWDK